MDSNNFMQVVTMTDEEKIKMYMAIPKKKLAEMLVEANRHLEVRFIKRTEVPESHTYGVTSVDIDYTDIKRDSKIIAELKRVANTFHVMHDNPRPTGAY